MKTCLTLFSLFLTLQLISQNTILGGSLLVEQVHGCESPSVQATLLIYGKSGSASNEVLLNWGDGTPAELVPPASQEPLPGQVVVRRYVAAHTFSGPGTYSISAEACCLPEDLANWSGQGHFFRPMVKHLLSDNPIFGCNSSPYHLFGGPNYVTQGQPFFYNPGFYDADGDSLGYSLVAPTGSTGYSFPDEVQPGPNNQLLMNALTATVTWDAPSEPGPYLLVLQAEQFRTGLALGTSEHWATVWVKETELTIFPNPVRDELILELSGANTADLKCRVFNPLGQLVMEEKILFENDRFGLMVNDLANGIYVLELESRGQKWVRKFVKT